MARRRWLGLGAVLAVSSGLVACGSEGEEVEGPRLEPAPEAAGADFAGDGAGVPVGGKEQSGMQVAPAQPAASSGESAAPPSLSQLDGTDTSVPVAPEPSEASGSSAPSDAAASAGCALAAGRPAGGRIEVEGEYIFDFPEAYDGVTPLPVLWAFHANANSNTQLLGTTPGTPLATQFVGVFPKSVGAGWDLGTDGPRFERWLDELSTRYCVDTSRMFAMGHSSGAQFIESLLCSGEDRFRAVAPVASARVCESWGPIPTLLLHGVNDTVRGTAGTHDPDGQIDLVAFVESNGCGTQTVPFAAPACERNGVAVNAGCVSYQGCAASTVWCNHDDPNYQDTNHGWPCFASQAIGDFFVAQL